MTTPFPGFAAPNPRTWSAGDDITTPRLRGDMTNLAALFAGAARPLLAAQSTSTALTTATVTAMKFGASSINTWNVNILNAAKTLTTYNIPLAGIYLVQGDVIFPDPPGTPAADHYVMGFDTVANGGGVVQSNCGSVPGSTSTATAIGAAGAELIQFNTFASTGDYASWFGFQTSGGTVTATGSFMLEWAGLPVSGLTDYTGPYGTVVAAPATGEAAFPPGPGTTITNGGGITAGATSMTVADATGMITGGTLGLDYINGQLYQPAAEVVSITSVTGLTIGISATDYAHLQGAPVAVPNSAAFLNQQVRDAVNFLAYPPMLRAAPTTTQSIPSQTFPAGTQITNLSAGIDNFSGFASNAYTAPVAGTYFVYGQVYFTGTTAATSYSAGIQVAAGTIQWGTLFYSDTTGGAQPFCPTVRRVLRLTAGQTIKLYGWQSSGGAISTIESAATNSRLICVWRSV